MQLLLNWHQENRTSNALKQYEIALGPNGQAFAATPINPFTNDPRAYTCGRADKRRLLLSQHWINNQLFDIQNMIFSVQGNMITSVHSNMMTEPTMPAEPLS